MRARRCRRRAGARGAAPAGCGAVMGEGGTGPLPGAAAGPAGHWAVGAHHGRLPAPPRIPPAAGPVPHALPVRGSYRSLRPHMCSAWFHMPGMPAAQHSGCTQNCLPGLAATAILHCKRTAALTPCKDPCLQLPPAAAFMTARHVDELEQSPMTGSDLEAGLLSQLGASDSDLEAASLSQLGASDGGGVREQGGQHRGRCGEGAAELGAHGLLRRQNGHPGPVLWRILLPDLSQRCTAGCPSPAVNDSCQIGAVMPLRLPSAQGGLHAPQLTTPIELFHLSGSRTLHRNKHANLIWH